MSTTNRSTVVAIYPTHTDAEACIKGLLHSGFNMNRLSIVGKDPQSTPTLLGSFKTVDFTTQWNKEGAFWGGLWSLLFGSTFFTIPGIGPFVVAGPLVKAIVAAREGAIVEGSMSPIGAGLRSIGVPEDSVRKYETVLKADACLLVAHGSGAEVARAKEIFETTASTDVGHYSSVESSIAEMS